MSLLVGLTGGMGSGKSLTASMFRELGACILDADVICLDLVKPNMPAWSEIVEKFGVGVLDKNKKLDRAGLAAIVVEVTVTTCPLTKLLLLSTVTLLI